MSIFLGGINGTSNSGKLTAITRANQNNVNKAVYWGQKYNQLNDERDRADDAGDMKSYVKLDRMAANFVSFTLIEDERFNIGDLIKVKESGETGKIISVDGSSGRYTILLDSGRTSDYMVSDIVDLEEALSQAAEKNSDDKGEEEEGGEVKESEISRNLNKSELSDKEQKALLKTFADGHGFTKAPKGEGNEIEMELDHMHGYNLTVNEAKAKADAMAKAPGNNNKEKAKVEGEDLLDDKAPETKDKTDFEGEDADGKNKEIGYNVREGVDANLADAPESGKKVKETKHVTSLDKFMNLAEAPGAEGDIDFEVNDEIGYNLDEADDLKKN
jgi:hypothetical protein